MLSILLNAAAFLLPTLALASCPPTHLSDIHRFPNGTWLENLAVRSNGHLVVTAYNRAQLWEINPFSDTHVNNSRLVHQFNSSGTITGLTELGEDEFVVIASNSLLRLSINGDQEEVSHINISIPAGNLNGIATLDKEGRVVAVWDSALGLIWRVEPRRTLTASCTMTAQQP